MSQTSLERLKTIPKNQLVWNSNENDPLKHTSAHESLFYQLPQDDQIVHIYGHKSPYHEKKIAQYYDNLQMKPIMVRKPALTAIDYLKQADKSLPNVRILLYGDVGQGKTHTLIHLLHYLHRTQKFFIVNFRNIRQTVTSPTDYEESNSRPGRINTPIDSAITLQQFRIQNAALLEKYQDELVCTSDYVWSAREKTQIGEPLIKVAEHGINRVIHASDCVAVLLKELALAADAGKIRLATVIDNVKYLFNDRASIIKHKDYKFIMVDEMTVPRSVKKLIRGNQRNSFTIATCDDPTNPNQNQTPREVLGTQGWAHFNPCLPIHVPKYSRQEFESCLNLYQDLDWLARQEARTQEARDEVRFISGMNPAEVAQICASL